MTRNLLKVVHLLGLVTFLGSILVFILVSELNNHASLERLASAREIISSGVLIFTLPGMWLAVLSGIALAYRSGRLRNGVVRLKAVLSLLIVVNAHFIVVPNVNKATAIAQSSLQAGALDPQYAHTYLLESIFGGINVLLILALIILAVTRLRPQVMRNPDRATFDGLERHRA